MANKVYTQTFMSRGGARSAEFQARIRPDVIRVWPVERREYKMRTPAGRVETLEYWEVSYATIEKLEPEYMP